MNTLNAFKDIKPLKLFNDWLQQAHKHPDIKQSNHMVLSNFYHNTKIKTQFKNHISSRVVLLKQVNQQKEQLIFYTNYNSVKKNQLTLYPTALNFYWPALNKQIRLEGLITKVSRKQSITYWKTRTWESQLSQYISKQSTILKDPYILKNTWEETKKKFYKKQIPCPLHWGGCAFKPYLIEFWKDKPNRLHDRLLFTKTNTRLKKWSVELLSP